MIDHELREIGAIARRLGVRVPARRLVSVSRDQTVFYGSQFTLLREPWSPLPHRLGAAYFHGRPGTPGYPEFDECFRVLRARHREVSRVQVSHAEMEELVLSSGIDAAKVFRIPIGIHLAYFQPAGRAARIEARAELGLPEAAFVVGSFQKDGVGFGEGLEPKAIKGPDVLLHALELLAARVPELHVLLSGPARGYVRAGLERLGIPYRHRLVARYDKIGSLYAALDAYVIPSRQEGGPKAVFEAMASGVPLVSTRVGQAADLVRDGENGWLVEVDDAEGLAHRLERIHSAGASPDVVAAGLATARQHDYEAQLPLWREFMDGFVRIS